MSNTRTRDGTLPVWSNESSTGLAPHAAAPLAYAGWWLTGLIFWFLERRDAYVRFHAAQAVAAFGIISALIGGFFVMAVVSLSFVPSAFTPFLWAAITTWVFGVLLWGVLMWHAARGRVWRIPLAAELADRMVRSG
jgi:uncharacterized membrane protein